MTDKEKAVAAIGGLGLVGGLVYLATRKVKAPPEGPPAAVKIEVYDSEGNLVPSNSPVTLDEGATYTVMVAVTNKTTRGGVPWEANLETIIMAATTLVDLIPYDVREALFAPNETKSFTSPLVIPVGLGGQTGAITVDVFDPAGILLAYAVEPLTIQSVAIIYGATVTIGV